MNTVNEYKFQPETVAAAEELSESLGYKPLSESQIALMNEIKGHGATLGSLVERLRATDGLDQRWVSMGCSDLQVGVMKLVRAVAQPSTF